MKTICIAGHCGSGKTTAIKVMEKRLPNSAVIRGDTFFTSNLRKYGKIFEEIYKTPMDMENPLNNFEIAHTEATRESIENYRRFFNAFAPSLENEIENAISEKKHGKAFILVEYVTLPIFKVWQYADCRIMIVSNKKARSEKLSERAALHNSTVNDVFTFVRETALSELIENADNVDFTVDNDYNEKFEKDLTRICQILKENSH